MKPIKKFEAFDGELFSTAEEARQHEAGHAQSRLVGLTPDQVFDAIERGDKQLADAIEAVASRIAKKRIADGDVKRRKKGAEASR
jgi:hypothetical protein